MAVYRNKTTGVEIQAPDGVVLGDAWKPVGPKPAAKPADDDDVKAPADTKE